MIENAVLKKVSSHNSCNGKNEKWNDSYACESERKKDRLSASLAKEKKKTPDPEHLDMQASMYRTAVHDHEPENNLVKKNIIM